MKKKPNPRVLLVMMVWLIIACIFPFPANLIIGFIGLIVIVILVGIAEYSVAKEEQQKPVDFTEEKEPPISGIPKKKTRPSCQEKHKPQIRVELENDKNNEWGPSG